MRDPRKSKRRSGTPQISLQTYPYQIHTNEKEMQEQEMVYRISTIRVRWERIMADPEELEEAQSEQAAGSKTLDTTLMEVDRSLGPNPRFARVLSIPVH